MNLLCKRAVAVILLAGTLGATSPETKEGMPCHEVAAQLAGSSNRYANQGEFLEAAALREGEGLTALRCASGTEYDLFGVQGLTIAITLYHVAGDFADAKRVLKQAVTEEAAIIRRLGSTRRSDMVADVIRLNSTQIANDQAGHYSIWNATPWEK